MNKISIIKRLISLTYKKTRVTGDSFILGLMRMFYQLSIGKCSPGEIFLYAPHLPSQLKHIPFFISKENSLAKLERFNDPKLQKLTEDKDIFYRICQENNLRVPLHVLTSVDGDEGLEKINAMLAADGGEQSAYDYFPDHFIKKDKNGAYASGFDIYHKKNGAFISAGGQRFTPGDFIELITRPGAVPCVVQQQVFGHRDLAEFAGTRVAQSVRLATIRINEPSARPGWFQMKIIGGDHMTDNFRDGYTGNFLAYGDLDSGILKGGVAGADEGIGTKTISHHPVTAKQVDGFQLPYWQETLDLACQAHDVFSELGVIGWDIAITDDGPVIFEGNVWQDPPFCTPWVMKREIWDLLFR